MLLAGDFYAATAGQLLEEGAFFAGESHRQQDFDAREEVAAALGAQARHPLPAQAKDTSVLRFRRDRQDQFAPVGRGDSGFAAQHRLYQVYLDVNVEIIALALKHGIWLDADNQHKVAARSPADAGLALAGHANLWSRYRRRAES